MCNSTIKFIEIKSVMVVARAMGKEVHLMGAAFQFCIIKRVLWI